MTRNLVFLMIAAAAPFVAAPDARAQSVLQVSAAVNGTFTNISPGGSLPLVAGASGQAVGANVTVRYSGTSAATITGVSVSGSSEISMIVAPPTPITLTPNSSTSFTLQYLSSSGNAANAQVAITFTENSQASSFIFFVSGSSSRLTFSYSVSNNAPTTLSPGSNITFPATNIGSSVQALVNVTNAGTAVGMLQSVSLTGAGFLLISAPSATQLQPGQQISFYVAFTPAATGSAQGTLSIVSGTGSVTFSLVGSGVAPNLTASYTLSDGNVHALSDGSVISFPNVDIKGSTTATITISNQGTAAGSVTGITVSGTGFQVSGLPLLPATVNAAGSLRFGIVFNPTQAGAYSGTFRIDMTGRSVSGSLTGSTSQSNLTLSYIDLETSNVIALSDNSTLQVKNTAVNAVSTVTVTVNNTGSGTGFINSIALADGSASAFQLVSLPSMPVTVLPSQQVRFGLRFSPQQQQTFTGALLINLNGQIVTINIQAQGTGAQYTYSLPSGATPLSPGDTITLPSVDVGKTSSMAISVTNTGTADGLVSIGVTGQGLTLTDLAANPLSVRSNATQQFTLNWAPNQPGPLNGRLTIGSDSFPITGVGLAPRLIYSYTNAAAAVPVSEGGAVIFTSMAVGATGTVDFTIENTGTSAATISSIDLSAPSTVFGLPQLPAMPFNLDAGANVKFPVTFLPNKTGTLTALMRINSTNFTLSGAGSQPTPLPAYRFQGATGNQQPAQQPAVGLSLSAPYPLPLQGTLTLSFASSAFADDPSVQFATGGRTVKFTIPANTTQAMFNGSATSVPLQTGTTAGDIVVTPSFAMTGGFDMTPSSPDLLTLTVPKAAPQLLTASIASQTTNSFTVLLNGYSTTRSLRQLDVTFTPKAGQTLSSSRLTVDLAASSSAWFLSAASQSFGGSFLIAIPFTLSNGVASADVVHMLDSVSITATNATGTSSSISVTIP